MGIRPGRVVQSWRACPDPVGGTADDRTPPHRARSPARTRSTRSPGPDDMNTSTPTKHDAAHRETSYTRGRASPGASNMTNRRDREVWHRCDAVHLAESRIRRQTAGAPRTPAHGSESQRSRWKAEYDCAMVGAAGPPGEQQTSAVRAA